MFLTDPTVIAVEQEVRRRLHDMTIFLLHNDRTKTYVVAQDLKSCKDRVNPWSAPEPCLVGVQGIGEKTTFKALFELITEEGVRIFPNANLIVDIINRKCPPRRDNARWKKFRQDQIDAENRPSPHIAALTTELEGDLARIAKGRKVFT